MKISDLRVVLVEPEGEVNIGFTCRVMYNFNVDKLYIVNPKVDISKAREFAAKATSILENAKVVEKLEDAIRDCSFVVATSSKASAEDLLRECVTPWELLELLRKVKGDIAIMFGRESTGLTRDEIRKAHVLVTIPANPSYPVLNLSHAIAIILYEIYKEFGKPHIPTRKGVTMEDVKLTEEYLDKILNILDISESRRRKYKLYIKRILIKGLISHGEARLLLSLLRKIYLALKSKL